MSSSTCPVCRSSDALDVLELPPLPVVMNARVEPGDSLTVPKGEMNLVVCQGCGHLFNRSFDEKLFDYNADYENTLHFSKEFHKFAVRLAQRLVADHELNGARVAELGSGPGHFLAMLCEAGVAEGLGYDPSYDPERLGAVDSPSVTISTELFPDDGSLQVPFAFSQHVLEHLDDPVAALLAQRSAVVDVGGVVYSEVPNGQLMIDHGALWDLIYEHPSYFVPTSLELACRRAGLEVIRRGTDFGDQFMWCEAVSGSMAPDAVADPDEVEQAVEAARSFGIVATDRIAEARADLTGYANEGPVALWGAGAKGMNYLNLVADAAPVAAVVDINPRKVGWGVPGTELVISGPDALVTVQPSTVLVANPVYVEEIAAQLDALGVSAKVRPLWD